MKGAHNSGKRFALILFPRLYENTKILVDAESESLLLFDEPRPTGAAIFVSYNESLTDYCPLEINACIYLEAKPLWSKIYCQMQLQQALESMYHCTIT